nr:GNAT family N-acetyltransferase [uncultured Agathobaculum sp.]
MIRFARREDTPRIRALWETCFPDEGGFNDYFFSHYFDPSVTLLSCENEVLCAMVQMLPCRLMVDGGSRSITYIYGACTDPAHRRKGHMARLLEQSFSIDRAAGRAATTLIPAEPWLFDFYRPFGYRPFFRVEKREIVQREPGASPTRLTVADIPQLALVYEQKTPVCRIVREERDWQEQIAMFDAIGRGVYGWFDGSRLTAYAFCWEDSAQEAIGLTGAQEQGLLHMLGRASLTVTGSGQGATLGCIKWYEEERHAPFGYMNLMLN